MAQSVAPARSEIVLLSVWDFICRAVGNKCRPEPPSSHGRTSTSIGAPGRPIIRDSCATEISVGDGMASTSTSRAWTRYLAAASRGHRGNPQKHMTYRTRANVNLVDPFSTAPLRQFHFPTSHLTHTPTPP